MDDWGIHQCSPHSGPLIQERGHETQNHEAWGKNVVHLIHSAILIFRRIDTTGKIPGCSFHTDLAIQGGKYMCNSRNNQCMFHCFGKGCCCIHFCWSHSFLLQNIQGWDWQSTTGVDICRKSCSESCKAGILLRFKHNNCSMKYKPKTPEGQMHLYWSMSSSHVPVFLQGSLAHSSILVSHLRPEIFHIINNAW